MITGAVLFPPQSNPVSNSNVTVAGDENGVLLTILGKGNRWDVYLPTPEARHLIYDLHRAVMHSIEAGAAA